MDRDQVMGVVKDHLAAELEVDIDRIDSDTRFKEDLDADSLDLYELVMEMEDRYGVKVSEEEAAELVSVGDVVEFVCSRASSG